MSSARKRSTSVRFGDKPTVSESPAAPAAATSGSVGTRSSSSSALSNLSPSALAAPPGGRSASSSGISLAPPSPSSLQRTRSGAKLHTKRDRSSSNTDTRRSTPSSSGIGPRRKSSSGTRRRSSTKGASDKPPEKKKSAVASNEHELLALPQEPWRESVRAVFYPGLRREELALRTIRGEITEADIEPSALKQQKEEARKREREQQKKADEEERKKKEDSKKEAEKQQQQKQKEEEENKKKAAAALDAAEDDDDVPPPDDGGDTEFKKQADVDVDVFVTPADSALDPETPLLGKSITSEPSQPSQATFVGDDDKKKKEDDKKDSSSSNNRDKKSPSPDDDDPDKKRVYKYKAEDFAPLHPLVGNWFDNTMYVFIVLNIAFLATRDPYLNRDEQPDHPITFNDVGSLIVMLVLCFEQVIIAIALGGRKFMSLYGAIGLLIPSIALVAVLFDITGVVHNRYYGVSVVLTFRLQRPLRFFAAMESFSTLAEAIVGTVQKLFDVIFLFMLFLVVASVSCQSFLGGAMRHRCVNDAYWDTNATVNWTFSEDSAKLEAPMLDFVCGGRYDQTQAELYYDSASSIEQQLREIYNSSNNSNNSSTNNSNDDNSSIWSRIECPFRADDAAINSTNGSCLFPPPSTGIAPLFMPGAAFVSCGPEQLCDPGRQRFLGLSFGYRCPDGYTCERVVNLRNGWAGFDNFGMALQSMFVSATMQLWFDLALGAANATNITLIFFFVVFVWFADMLNGLIVVKISIAFEASIEKAQRNWQELRERQMENERKRRELLGEGATGNFILSIKGLATELLRRQRIAKSSDEPQSLQAKITEGMGDVSGEKGDASGGASAPGELSAGAVSALAAAFGGGGGGRDRAASLAPPATATASKKRWMGAVNKLADKSEEEKQRIIRAASAPPSPTAPADPASAAAPATDANQQEQQQQQQQPDLKARIRAMLRKNAPKEASPTAQAKAAEDLIKKYSGREQALLDALVKKYGAEPPAAQTEEYENTNAAVIKSAAVAAGNPLVIPSVAAAAAKPTRSASASPAAGKQQPQQQQQQKKNVVAKTTTTSSSTSKMDELDDVCTACFEWLRPCRRILARKLLMTKWYFFFIAFVNLANVVIVAMHQKRMSSGMIRFVKYGDIGCLCIITLDGLLRAFVMTPSVYFSVSKKHVFETVLTLLAWTDILLDYQNLKALRIGRALRPIELLTYSPGIFKWVRFAVVAVKSSPVVLFALFSLIFVFALGMMQLLGGAFCGLGDADIFSPDDAGGRCGTKGPRPRAHFDDFGHALLTSFQVITGDNWDDVMFNAMTVRGWWLGAFFSLYYFFGAYMMLALLTGIILSRFEQQSMKEDVKTRARARGGHAPPAPGSLEASGSLQASASFRSRRGSVQPGGGLTESPSSGGGGMTLQSSKSAGDHHHAADDDPASAAIAAAAAASGDEKEDHHDENNNNNDDEPSSPSSNFFNLIGANDFVRSFLSGKAVQISMFSKRGAGASFLGDDDDEEDEQQQNEDETDRKQIKRLLKQKQQDTKRTFALKMHSKSGHNDDDDDGTADDPALAHLGDDEYEALFGAPRANRANTIVMDVESDQKQKRGNKKQQEQEGEKKCRSWWEFRKEVLQPIARHKITEAVILFIIIISIIGNLLTFALTAPDTAKAQTANYFEIFTRSLFVFEALFMITAYGIDPRDPETYLRRTRWHVFEFVITVMNFISIFLTVFVSRDSVVIPIFGTATAIRPLRIVRRSPSMALVLKALANALIQMRYAITAIFLLILLYSVAGLQIFAGKFDQCIGNITLDQPACEAQGLEWNNPLPTFDNLFESLFSVFQILTLELWTELMYIAMDIPEAKGLAPRANANAAAALYFVLFAVIGGWFCVSIFMSVLVDAYNRCKRSESAQRSLLIDREQNGWIKSNTLLLRALPNHAQMHEARHTALFSNASALQTGGSASVPINCQTSNFFNADGGGTSPIGAGAVSMGNLGAAGASFASPTGNDGAPVVVHSFGDGSSNNNKNRPPPPDITDSDSDDDFFGEKKMQQMSIMNQKQVQQVAAPPPPTSGNNNSSITNRSVSFGANSSFAAMDVELQELLLSSAASPAGSPRAGDGMNGGDEVSAAGGLKWHQRITMRVRGCMTAWSAKLDKSPAYRRIQRRFADIIVRPWFIIATNLFTVLNFLLLCMQIFPEPPAYGMMLEVLQNLLGVLFMAEAVTKILGESFSVYIASKWNKFDFFVAVSSMLGLVFINFLDTRFRSAIWSIRLVRLVKIFRGRKSLATLVAHFGIALQSLAGVFAVICIFYFAFAVFATQVFGKVVWQEDVYGSSDSIGRNANFANVPMAMYTLVRIAFMGNWPHLYWGVRNGAPGCDERLGNCGPGTPMPQLFFVVSIIFFSYICRNMVLAILIDSFSTAGDIRCMHKWQAKAIVKAWRQYDPDFAGILRGYDIVHVLRRVPMWCPIGFRHFPHSKRISLEIAALTLLNIDDPNANLFKTVAERRQQMEKERRARGEDDTGTAGDAAIAMMMSPTKLGAALMGGLERAASPLVSAASAVKARAQSMTSGGSSRPVLDLNQQNQQQISAGVSPSDAAASSAASPPGSPMSPSSHADRMRLSHGGVSFESLIDVLCHMCYNCPAPARRSLKLHRLQRSNSVDDDDDTLNAPDTLAYENAVKIIFNAALIRLLERRRRRARAASFSAKRERIEKGAMMAAAGLSRRASSKMLLRAESGVGGGAAAAAGSSSSNKLKRPHDSLSDSDDSGGDDYDEMYDVVSDDALLHLPPGKKVSHSSRGAAALADRVMATPTIWDGAEWLANKIKGFAKSLAQDYTKPTQKDEFGVVVSDDDDEALEDQMIAADSAFDEKTVKEDVEQKMEEARYDGWDYCEDSPWSDEAMRDRLRSRQHAKTTQKHVTHSWFTTKGHGEDRMRLLQGTPPDDPLADDELLPVKRDDMAMFEDL